MNTNEEVKHVHDEDVQRIGKILSNLAQSIDTSASSMAITLTELKREIQELKETRYKPYFTSVGLFVVITLAVTGYVYNLESRITAAIFNIQNQISSNSADIKVNTERVGIHAERAMARQEHTIQREQALGSRIDDNKKAVERAADAVIEHISNARKHKDETVNVKVED